MRRKTQITNALEVARYKAYYNAKAKKIFANKIILAWILKYSAKEYKDFSIEEIKNCIEGEPEISAVPLYPGKERAEAITGMQEDDDVPNEGDITYDIRFYAYVPSLGTWVKLIINLEIQNSYYPGYKLPKRGMFYCSRMLSAQLDTEFSTDNYDDIKKVYSIFICSNSPKYAKNTITRYEMAQNNLYGNFPENSDTDLLSLVMIHLKIAEPCQLKEIHPLIGLLTTLLTAKLSPKEKLKILEEEYNIATYKEMEGEFDTMCDLADYFEEYGIKQGMEKGVKMGLEQGLEQGLQQGLEALITTIKPLLPDFESVYKAVISNQNYANVTKETVRKYYTA